MPKSQIMCVLAIAAVTAGCSSTPSYYTARVSDAPAPSTDAYARSAAADVGARPARRQALPPRQARAPQPEASEIETSAALRQPASENIDGTTASAQAPAADTRAERERRQKMVEEQRERALKRSINSICRGC